MAADFLKPGAREIGRRLNRLYLRARLWQRRRQLARAETELGLLGWQQADFDAETQRQVSEIQNVEREQTRLINAAADRGAAGRRLKAEYEAAQRAFQEERRALQTEEKAVREPRADLERQLAEKRKTEPNLERRMPDLDRELREVSKLLTQTLQTEPQTLKIRQEILRLRERTVAIPNEKNDLRTQHLRTVSAIRSLEQALEENDAALARCGRQISARQTAWAEEERRFQEQIREEEREKAKLEKRINSLEGAKENPYQTIGRVLAQNNIGPMNQPQALKRVTDLCFLVGALEQRRLESEAGTRRENATELRHSLLVWGTIAVVVLILLYAAR